ncbi:MAG: serine/threonine-protein kinase [Rubripirellula sp.]
MPDNSIDFGHLFQLARRQELSDIDSEDLNAAESRLLDELKSLQARIQTFDSEPKPQPEFDFARLLQRLRFPLESASPNPATADLDSSLQDEIPAQIGDYEIRESIGRGGCADVYRAHHRLLHQDFAIKAIRTSENPVSLERFQREMRVIAALRCPHVITATDAREQDDRLYLVTEFVDGITLSQLIQQQGPLPVGHACELVRQTCSGLRVIHKLGIVHRDLKPSNLMINRDAIVKILDLGLVSLRGADNTFTEGSLPATSLTSASHLMGTVDYVSPEQIDDARIADARSDFYSLGCVLHFLLTGQVPFPTSLYPSKIARLIAHQAVSADAVDQIRVDVPSPVVELVSSLLQKNPDDRPSKASEIMDQLAPHCSSIDLTKLSWFNVA